MTRSLVLYALVLASGCSPGVRQPAVPVSEHPSEAAVHGLPDDASRVVDRLSACTHFAGEFNGDRSDRDKEVTATMTQLRCDSIDRDVEAIRSKYAGNKAVEKALAAASEF